MANSQTDAGRPEHCSERGEYTSHNMFGSRWTTCPTCAEAEHNDREAAIAAVNPGADGKLRKALAIHPATPKR